MQDKAISLIENDSSQDRLESFEGGEILANIEFTKYLFRTRNYISFDEFMRKHLSSLVDNPYYEDMLLFWEEEMKYRRKVRDSKENNHST